MITAKAFVSIETALSSRIVKELGLVTSRVYDSVTEALSLGDRDRAVQELGTLRLDVLREKLKDYVGYMTSVAMLFGASRVTQQPGTSVVGLGFEAETVKQMASNLITSITLQAEAHLKDAGVQFIFPKEVLKDDAPARILLPFASFMDARGKAYMNTVSALHTSRVSAYGYTAEALALGYEEYQLNEQLDIRTCPVCRIMHGKVFKVTEARQTLEVVCRTTDPEQLRSLQPWPSQTKAAVEALAGMTNDEIVQKNWHIPPFHPGCRGLLSRAGKAPPLKQVITATVPDNYEATKEDFSALKVSASPKQVKLWNEAAKLPPSEVIARLTDRPVDAFLEGLLTTPKVKDYTGVTSFSMAKNVTIRITSAAFGSSLPFDQAVKILPASKSLYLEALDLASDDQAKGVVKGYMRELYTLAKDMELSKIELLAGLDVGGYAWAKYGFRPNQKSWDALRGDLRTRMANLTLDTTQLELEALRAITQSTDPSSIFALADIPAGKQLLLGTLWVGELDLNDPEAVVRFLTYIGELK